MTVTLLAVSDNYVYTCGCGAMHKISHIFFSAQLYRKMPLIIREYTDIYKHTKILTNIVSLWGNYSFSYLVLVYMCEYVLVCSTCEDASSVDEQSVVASKMSNGQSSSTFYCKVICCNMHYIDSHNNEIHAFRAQKSRKDL